MKKFLIPVILALFAGGLLFFKLNQNSQTKPLISNITPAFSPQTRKAVLIIDFGNEIKASYQSEIETETTVFDLLKETAEDKGFVLKTKQYDFGIFIESIDQHENTKDKSWIFTLNGESAPKSADNIMVKPGDIIEWKYTEPIF